ncbi:MAG: hypothetical protein QM682_11580 [Paracoccus sp. (in: a-proteobacteria)]|uniref:hypothetical protein n=1 Tax=Paracoccus sp. TaxID=267 RepID=UPI0039E640B8
MPTPALAADPDPAPARIAAVPDMPATPPDAPSSTDAASPVDPPAIEEVPAETAKHSSPTEPASAGKAAPDPIFVSQIPMPTAPPGDAGSGKDQDAPGDVAAVPPGQASMTPAAPVAVAASAQARPAQARPVQAAPVPAPDLTTPPDFGALNLTPARE